MLPMPQKHSPSDCHECVPRAHEDSHSPIVYINFPRQMKCAFVTEDCIVQEPLVIFYPV
jgi:hypothetical protein